jgi:predicted amidohydrolase YtcJ
VAANLILTNGRFTTLDAHNPSAEAVAIAGGTFIAVGSAEEIDAHRDPRTRAIDLRGRRVIPGLIDSHTHVIRGGLSYNLELRWDGVRSLAEYFVARYGASAAERTPPVRRMLDAGLPVGAGTDATRVASYNPWVSLSWLLTGRTLGGLALYPRPALLDRETALRLWTERNSWFSNEERGKGRIEAGQLADLAVLSRDYFSVADSDIQDIEAVLTLLGGKIVYGAEEFSGLGPSLPAAMPDWSPVRTFGGYQSSAPLQKHACAMHRHARALPPTLHDPNDFWGALGCSCWAF